MEHQRRGNIQNNDTYKLVQISDDPRFLGKPPDVPRDTGKNLEKLVKTRLCRVDFFLSVDSPESDIKSTTVAYMRATYESSKRSRKAVQFSLAL